MSFSFRSPSLDQFFKAMSSFIATAAAMVLAFAPSGSSQVFVPPPSWTVQSTDPAHGLLILNGSVRTGVDTGMLYVVQFRLEGVAASQLARFRSSLAVVLQSALAAKIQAPTHLGAKTSTASALFTGIPTTGQRLLISASGISPVEGVVVNVTGPQTYVAGGPGAPCCAVTALNSQTGAVTAKVNTSGHIFMFQAPMHEGPPPGPGQPPSYQQLNIGQPVWANFTTGQVSLDGKTPCCQITAEGIPSSGSGGKPTPLGAKPAAGATQACCEITAINQQARTASAQVKSSRQTFEIAVTNPALLQSLRVGQAIWANFQTRQVSINGVGPIDGMQVIASGKAGSPIIARGPGITVPKAKPPFTAIPSPSSPPLTIHDHTLIMQAVIQHRVYLATKISLHNWRQATIKQITTGAMLYLLKSPSLADTTKERIRVYLAILKKTKFAAPSAEDLSFIREASAILGTTNDRPSAIGEITTFQQKYGNKRQSLPQRRYANTKQSRYQTALDSAKELINDGASTIYSSSWLQQVASAPTPQADNLDPCGNADINDSCIGGGGGSPFPGEGGCDPTTDPACNACPDPNNPTCNTGTCPDPNNPACNSCPDPNNPACNTGTCPDPNNPACNSCPDPNNPDCSPPPPVCPDANNPACSNQPPCLLVPCGPTNGSDPCSLILNPTQSGCPSPIPVPVQKADGTGCIFVGANGLMQVLNKGVWWLPAAGCAVGGVAWSTVKAFGLN